MSDNKEVDQFVDENEVLIIAGKNNDGYSIRICQKIDVEELADVLCYIIKTALSNMEDAKNINEVAELEILQLVEQKLIEDDAPYLINDDDEFGEED